MLLKTLREKPKEQLAAASIPRYHELMDYVAFLVEHSKKDLDQLDLSRLPDFSFDEDGMLVIAKIDRTAINKAVAELPEPEAKPELTIDESIFKALHEAQKARRRSKEREIEGAITRTRSQAENYSHEAMARFRELAELTDKLARLKQTTDTDLTPQLQRIQNDGFWKVEAADGYSLIFSSIPVRVAFSSLEDGVERSYLAGKWQAQLTLHNLGLSLRPLNTRETPRAAGHYHPHVSTSEQLCLGNASASYSEAVALLDLYRMLKIAQVILTTYSPANPYVRFSEFEEAYKRIQTQALRSINAKSLRQHYEQNIASDDIVDFYDEYVPAI